VVGDFVRYLAAHQGEVLALTLEHLVLVGVAVGLAIAVGLPLGILATRHRRVERPVMGMASVLQTIPSLALFGFLIPVPIMGGVGARTAIVALTLYALLPIVRNTYAGIRGIDPALREAALGMGMTDRQLLTRVELPLAAGVILAGVRVATVISVGIATIAAAIGAGGLGVYIFQGLAMVDDTVILAGAVPAALLALAADGLLGLLERRLTPAGAPGARRDEARPQ
jgi:osmoprotectant transport system permease protein